MEYSASFDIRTIRENLSMEQEEFASLFGLDKSLLARYEKGSLMPSNPTLERIYDYAYHKGIRLNVVKEMLYRESLKSDELLLFHGSKKGIEGEPTIEKSEPSKDFGKGFYLGDSFQQSAMFVNPYPESSIYFFRFQKEKGSKVFSATIDLSWVLAICHYRGYLKKYDEHPLVQSVVKQIEESDLVIAPIADNRMFTIMSDFANELITDVECMRSLAASNLGLQYVFRNDGIINSSLQMLEKSFLCSSERKRYNEEKKKQNEDAEQKAKIIKREYRGKGQFIDQLLK